jgi:hypothetical protein
MFLTPYGVVWCYLIGIQHWGPVLVAGLFQILRFANFDVIPPTLRSNL